MDSPKAGATRASTSRWLGIDHVQLAIPVGGEAVARAFYVDTLGMTEVTKPPALAVRGGAWFQAGAVELHVGVEAEFVPARKAHPALVVDDVRGLVEATGLAARWSDEIPGTTRCHIDDPFGNRIELIDANR